jgi:hypothetical protein
MNLKAIEQNAIDLNATGDLSEKDFFMAQVWIFQLNQQEKTNEHLKKIADQMQQLNNFLGKPISGIIR